MAPGAAAPEPLDTVFDRCEIHHLLPWELGGSTDLANLVPICSRHHHVVHDGGWQLEFDADRLLTIRRADGEVFDRTRPDVIPRSSGRRRRTAA